jgi:hypothetical protein
MVVVARRGGMTSVLVVARRGGMTTVLVVARWGGMTSVLVVARLGGMTSVLVVTVVTVHGADRIPLGSILRSLLQRSSAACRSGPAGTHGLRLRTEPDRWNV